MGRAVHLILIVSKKTNQLQIKELIHGLAVKKVSFLGESGIEFATSIEKQGVLIERRAPSLENLNEVLAANKDEDVLMLQDCVEVSCSDVERMAECAYSDERIAAVMPMMAGFPLIDGSYLPVLDECDQRGFAEAVGDPKVDFQSVQESVPYVSDQCCYIRADVLENCLYFKANSYTSIQNALIDWCMNAALLGYKCVLCGNAYAEIKEMNDQVFTEGEAERQVTDTYAWDCKRVLQFNWKGTAQRIKDQVLLRKTLCNGRKNILYVLHRDYADDAANHIGGTQFHVKDLVREVRKKYNVAVLARDWGCVRLSAYDSDEQVIVKIPISDSAPYPRLYHEELAQLMRGIYQALPFDLVHIHHTYQLSFDVFTETKRAGIPMVCTLHDYYYLCPSMKMLDENNCCCVGHMDEKRCEGCWRVRSHDCNLPESLQFLKQWRKASRNALGMCEMLFTPSSSSKGIITLYYPELSDRIRIIPHGIDMTAGQEYGNEPVIENADVMGNIDIMPDAQNAQIIGWCILEGVEAEQSSAVLLFTLDNGERVFLPTQRMQRDDVANLYGPQQRMSGFSALVPRRLLMQELKVCLCVSYQGRLYQRSIVQTIPRTVAIETKKFNVAFVGGLSVEKGSRIALEMIQKGPSDIGWFMIGGCGDRELKYFSKPNFTDLGWYQREDLKELLQVAKIDVICILPILSETFCYVLSEAMMCGIPVIVTDIGALGERVRKDGSGWIVPVENAAQHALQKIDMLRRHPQELNAVRNRLGSIKQRSVENMDQDYLASYRELKLGPRSSKRFDYNSLIQMGNGEVYQLKIDLQTAVQQLSVIENSRTYKIVRAFELANIPGKKQMMSFAYWMARKMKLNV